MELKLNSMILLFDIGNTHTHVGLANDRRVVKQTNIPTRDWFGGNAAKLRGKICRREQESKARRLCSVVPRATPLVRKTVRAALEFERAGTHAQNLARRGH